MRRSHNRVHLPSPNRPKVPHRLLIRKPHGAGSGRNPYSNRLRLCRRTYFNNCTRPHFFCTLLLGKHQLRANPQPNHASSTRPPNSPTPNNNMMIYCQPRQPRPSPTTKPHGRTNDCYLLIQLVLVISCPHWGWYAYYSQLLPLHIPHDPTWPPPSTHPGPQPLPHP